MKKLYINIEEIKIKGEPSLLSQPVSDIDKRMQELASATELTRGIICKFSGTNRGKQYQKVSSAVTKLSKYLFEASETLNDVQYQIVAFENKCHCYEGEMASAASPRPHNVRKVSVAINTSEIEFHKSEMIKVRDSLEKYSNIAKEECKMLRSNRDSIGKVWTDRQFKDFSAYVDEVYLVIVNGCKELDEYRYYLDRKIKDLD